MFQKAILKTYFVGNYMVYIYLVYKELNNKKFDYEIESH